MPAQLSATFLERGFVAAAGLVGAAAQQALRGRLTACALEAATDEAPRSFGDMLRASAHGIRLFWDESLPGADQSPPEQRWRHVARAGHAAHLVDEVVASVLTAPELLDLVRVAIPEGLELLTSVFICKHPGGSVQFGPHQDTWYLHARPERIVSLMLALDDTDLANGCLHVAPGSHRLPSRVRAVPGQRDWSEQRLDDHAVPECDVALPVRAGDAILYDGRLYHASDLNRTGAVRRVLIAQYGAVGLEWSTTNWLEPPEGGFARVG